MIGNKYVRTGCMPVRARNSFDSARGVIYSFKGKPNWGRRDHEFSELKMPFHNGPPILPEDTKGPIAG
jgi:hypothetical protein